MAFRKYGKGGDYPSPTASFGLRPPMRYEANVTWARFRIFVAFAAFGPVLLIAAAGQPKAAVSLAESKRGGTFNVSFVTNALDYVDPALSYSDATLLLDATCARLMNYPDKPPPEGLRLIPEVAAAPPRMSKDAKTYTFRLRSGFRFSDGKPVQASAFARAINRILALGVDSAGFSSCGTSSAQAQSRPGSASPPLELSRTAIGS